MTEQTYKISWFEYLIKGVVLPFNGTVAFAGDGTSEHPFTPHYKEFIRPQVDGFEEKRIESLKTIRKRLLISLPIALLSLFACLFSPFFLIIPLGLALWTFAPLYYYKLAVKEKVFPHVFRFFGSDFEYYPQGFLSIRELRPSGLIPNYDNSRTEDYIKGTYNGVGLEITEAHLTDKRTSGSGKNRSTRHVTVFKGIFIRLTMNKRFNGKTVVRRDGGFLGNLLKGTFSKLDTVRLEDPVFEKAFEVYTDDQVEARYLLTTSFMERLLKLGAIIEDPKTPLDNITSLLSSSKSNIQASFYDSQLLLMIPSKKDRFETASILKPATFKEDINAILKEMEQIFQIIDTLKLEQRTGL